MYEYGSSVWWRLSPWTHEVSDTQFRQWQQQHQTQHPAACAGRAGMRTLHRYLSAFHSELKKLLLTSSDHHQQRSHLEWHWQLRLCHLQHARTTASNTVKLHVSRPQSQLTMKLKTDRNSCYNSGPQAINMNSQAQSNWARHWDVFSSHLDTLQRRVSYTDQGWCPLVLVSRYLQTGSTQSWSWNLQFWSGEKVMFTIIKTNSWSQLCPCCQTVLVDQSTTVRDSRNFAK